MYKEYEAIILGTQLKHLLDKKSEPLMLKYSLREVELEILAYLSNKKNSNIAKDIMKHKHISKAHISKSVENLRTKGFIYLEEDNEDHRIIHICPTKAAEEVVADFMKIHIACRDVLFSNITEQEKEVVAQVFHKMQDNINRELGQD